MKNEYILSFYLKASIFILGLFTFVAILYIAQDILIPLVLALIIAIVLHPIVAFFIRLKINRVVAITITLFLTFLIIAACSILFFSQAKQFSESWPILVDKFTALLNQTITTISSHFGSNPQLIYDWITKTKLELTHIGTETIGQTLMIVGNGVTVLLLVPVYVFLLLFYHPLLLEFIHRLFAASQQKKLNEIITQTKILIQHYLVGLIIEAIIIAALYAMALMVFGIEYAILLGVIGALLNVIPYIGGIVGVALPMMVALATKETGWSAIYVLVVYYFIQLIDNNYIVPKIVASKVKINALFSIIVVLVGNALWGITGMFLSIPILAIVKLVFDHIEPLKPWGFLLGDTMPQLIKFKSIFSKNKLV